MTEFKQMGSSAEKSPLEITEDVHLLSSQQILNTTTSLEMTPPRSFCFPISENLVCKLILSSIYRSIKIALLSNKLNMLLPCGTLAILVDGLTNHHVLNQFQGWVFSLSLLGIIPLAERFEWVTGQFNRFNGPTVGNILNATFGNATELIVSIYALKSGMIHVVQQSLLGSILCSMLLVLGCAMFGGGIVSCSREQVFNQPYAAMSSRLLLMAVMSLLFPTILHHTHTESHFGKSELALSRFSSCVMLIAYGAYIFFQLTSQKHLYTHIYEEEESQTIGSSDYDELPDMSNRELLIWLFIFTSLISISSESLVDAIEGAAVAMGIPVAFISTILLPVVGNAGGIIYAVKDELDVSVGAAIGSSTRIAMFVIPSCVVVGWIMDRPMDLNFQLLETTVLIVAVLVVTFMLQEGRSNYLKGLILLLCYLIVATSFFVHMDPIY